MGPDDIVRTPEPDPNDTVDCPRCHGAGDFGCINGCHSEECDFCDGSGRIPADAA